MRRSPPIHGGGKELSRSRANPIVVELQLWRVRESYRQGFCSTNLNWSRQIRAITFLTALWFWMTPQPPNSSCHDAIRASGFGMTINIINGGIECGKGQPTPQALDRIKLYQQYARLLGVTPGDNLYC